MALELIAGEGPLKDQVFTITDGMTFGRAGASVEIQDGKVSTVHARVRMDENGVYFLIDDGSKNGIRAEGERVSHLELKSGVEFSIGDQSFRVLGKDKPEEKPAEPSPKKIKKPAKSKYWYDAIGEFLSTNINSFQDKVKTFQPLEPALVLEFVRGIQANSKWVLGYGPRKIGSTSIDLPIWQPGAPAVCFEILPEADGILFKTGHPELVLVNDQSVDSKVLHVGDTIKIMDTIIEVDFIE